MLSIVDSQPECWTPDGSTEQGVTTLRKETIADYLTSLGVYDTQRRRVTFNASQVAVSVQQPA